MYLKTNKKKKPPDGGCRPWSVECLEKKPNVNQPHSQNSTGGAEGGCCCHTQPHRALILACITCWRNVSFPFSALFISGRRFIQNRYWITIWILMNKISQTSKQSDGASYFPVLRVRNIAHNNITWRIKEKLTLRDLFNFHSTISGPLGQKSKFWLY